MVQKITALLFTLLMGFPFFTDAQVVFQPKNENGIQFGTYGRVGVDWSFVHQGSIGRRLNLNNMGSIGGRLEEQDYVELVSAFLIRPFKENDPTVIKAQSRFSVYSRSLSLFGNSTTTSLGGLTIALPEFFVEASNINGKNLTVWVGATLGQAQDVGICDHFYFNDHAGQGFGIKYKNTHFKTLFISSTDTTSTGPSYYYISVGTGSPSLALRQRVVFILEHDVFLAEQHRLKLLGELHRMGGSDLNDFPIPEPYIADSARLELDIPTDYGYVVGAKLFSQLGENGSKGYNRLALRYGMRLANGGDGGFSKTWNTYGAPDLEQKNFKGAYSLSIVNDFFTHLSDNNDLNAYLVFTASKGAAESDNMAKTYLGREIYNRKRDFTVGCRDVHYISEKFHLLGEVHYSQRRDGTEKTNAYTKFSLAPTFVPTGHRDFGARPHFRFVCSLARYNDAAKENMYSPYLQFVGPKRWGYYFGVKAEWWL